MMALLKIGDVARICNVSERLIYKQVAADRIPHVKIGGALRFPPDAIEKWIEKGGIRE